ncbi:MAG: HAMP domain-containing histidine kinase [Bacteriovorax sp.]|nr:HAMP domain-containing histidine kinase [Bacteriovorax sp.]
MKIKNPFDHSSKVLFSLSLVWAGVLLMIGVWWIYLIFNFENILAHTDRIRITKMIVWEGGSFLTLLLLLSISLLLLYLKDQKKTKSLQDFFASLTHELKTPLASIRLQGEVINEILASKNDTSLNKLSSRLIEDTGKLETQMDKILQLSRIERGGELNLTSLKIIPYIKNLSRKWASSLSIDIESSDMEASIVADEFALELIIKNLFENTRIHTKSKNVKIKIHQTNKNVVLTYQDQGEFTGDKNKLGTLFYKHNSSKGSGIGLYLTNKLLEKMRGELRIGGDKNLIFSLTFQKSEDLNA